jgi:hypothetical protein
MSQGNRQYGSILTFNFFEILFVKINLHENLVMFLLSMANVKNLDYLDDNNK